MRFRKARGKKPAVVTLTEDEVVEACCRYVKDRVARVGSRIWLVTHKGKKDKLGRKRKGKVEFGAEIHSASKDVK
jgi:hypothetical protein